MVIQFDLGNSAVKWRALAAGKVAARGVFGCNSGAMPAELRDLVAGAREIQIASVAAMSITNQLVDELRELGADHITCAVSQKEQLGLVSAYSEPEQMGVDRWLAMLAIWSVQHQPFIVVDAGSAITIDVVTAVGQHEGGYILPGRALLLTSLQTGTSRVLFDLEDDAATEPGVNTQSCVARGVGFLWRGLAGQVASTAAARGITSIWVTGGDAERLQEVGLSARYSQDLVLDGLGIYCRSAPELGSSL